MPAELGKHHGKPIFVKIHGDIATVYFEGRLVVQNWVEGHLLSIDNVRRLLQYLLDLKSSLCLNLL